MRGSLHSSTAWAVVVCAASLSSAIAGPRAADETTTGFVRTLLDAAQNELTEAVAARVPALVPPKPVRVHWRARRLGSVDLRAPMLTLGSADLDGDGRAELIALTSDAVVLLRPTGSRQVAVVTRAALASGVPAIHPRDPLGTLVFAPVELPDGGRFVEIQVRSSERAQAEVFVLREGAFARVRRFDGFPLCPGSVGELASGRNYFVASKSRWTPNQEPPAVTSSFYSVACASALLDVVGRPQSSIAIAGVDGTLTLKVRRTCGDQETDFACRENPSYSTALDDVGVAFVVADIDNDGRPEVVSSSSRPPGDADRVLVRSPRGARWKRVFEHSFSGGIVGVTAADISGDGKLEVVVAVRLIGANRVDLWRLN